MAAANAARAAAHIVASVSRSVAAQGAPNSCTGETTREMAGMVITSSHKTVVVVRDEKTATLQANNDAPTKAPQVPGENETRPLPRVAASSTAATDHQLSRPGRMETSSTPPW